MNNPSQTGKAKKAPVSPERRLAPIPSGTASNTDKRIVKRATGERVVRSDAERQMTKAPVKKRQTSAIEKNPAQRNVSDITNEPRRKPTTPVKKPVKKYNSSYEDSGDAEFDEDLLFSEDETEDDFDDFEDVEEDDSFYEPEMEEVEEVEERIEDFEEEEYDEENEEEISRVMEGRYQRKNQKSQPTKKTPKKVRMTVEGIDKKLANPYEGLKGEKLKKKVIDDAADEIVRKNTAENNNSNGKKNKKAGSGSTKKVSIKDKDVTELNNFDFKKLKKVKVPKSVQESIPYVNVYKDGEIEIEEGVFTVTYFFDDTNFKIEAQQRQEELFFLYGDLINTFGADVGLEVSIYSKTMHKEVFLNKIKMKPRRDSLNKYREEFNGILCDKMDEGRNNLSKSRYVTLTIIADDIKEAKLTFSGLNSDISSAVKKITGTAARQLSLEERMIMLYNIYNMGSDFELSQEINRNGNKIKSFDLPTIAKMGLSTKDVIAPESLTFNSNYFMMGEKFGRVLFLESIPSYLNCEILPDIANTPCNMITSVYFNSIRQDKALKMLKNQMVNINSNVVDAQKRASKSGFSADLISPELMNAQSEAKSLLDDLTTRNQKLYLVTLVITHFADDIEQLDKDTRAIQTSVAKHLCQLKALSWQQEAGFNASLPLGCNKLHVNMLLTTESASVFIPFSVKELNNEGGFYYGLNAVSKNMIIYNRTKGSNYNAVILGVPGGGKSFSAKREIISVLLGTNDDVYVIDPEREYTPLAGLLGGAVIKLAVGSNTHLNPFDMDLEYGDDDDSTGDPIALKSDFISSLCETIIGGKFGLSPIQKSIIDRCVRKLYRKYLEYMNTRAIRDGVTIDESKMPTMKDFYHLLIEQSDPEAQDLAISLERYAEGSLDTFAYRTNVRTKARFVVYDIKDIGTGLKELGLQVCLDNIWNKIISNKKKGIRTWFYIDEFYLLMQTESSAIYLKQIWKRARKWNGVPTGITQNVEDLLSSKEGRGIINNCEMVIMLKQSPIDKEVLSGMFNISATQQQYITNSDEGQGLLYNGKTIIPFEDKFPRDTELYKVMTTKPDDVDISKFIVKTA